MDIPKGSIKMAHQTTVGLSIGNFQVYFFRIFTLSPTVVKTSNLRPIILNDVGKV